MKRNKLASKILKYGTLSLILFTMVFSFMFSNMNVGASTKIADPSTVIKFRDSLGDYYSTEFAGRIWTDKSVYAESVELDGNTYSATENEFLNVFSVLATAESITGQQGVPVDVVFVIDMSNSMNQNPMGNGNRLTNMVTALNNSVASLLNMNPNNRIAVVNYNRNSNIVLELDHYTRRGNEPFFKLDGNTLITNAVRSNKQQITNKRNPSQSGTNIQQGIAYGMNILAENQETTITINNQTYTRIPSVVLLSDGSPTSSSTWTNWWNVAKDETDQDYEYQTRARNGMKAMMTAAYYKKAIDENYFGSADADKTTVYTVGVGIDSASGNERDLARVTINPTQYLNATNSMATTIRNAWNTYKNNGTPTVDSYKFNHPNTGIDISGNDIYYVDQYFNVTNADSFIDAFEDIVADITISTPQVPTEVKGEDPLNDGWITYTDPLGEYMSFNDIKGIIFHEQAFNFSGNNKNADLKIKSTEDDGTTVVTTYEVTSSIKVNTFAHGAQDLNNLEIKVTKDKASKNEVVEIRVPAALIPLHINTVKLDDEGKVISHTHNGANPLHVIYGVKIQNDIIENNHVDTSKVSSTYLANNTNEDGTVNFYSNLFTNTNSLNGNSAGDATVTFEPSHSNGFYYLLEDSPIYTYNSSTKKYEKAQGASKNSLVDTNEYYLKVVYYHGQEVVEKYTKLTGAQLKGTDIISKQENNNHYLYREAGSPTINRLMVFEGTKGESAGTSNVTKTAQDFYAPTFEYATNNTDAYAGQYKIYLGNNGKLSIAATGTLTIEKEVIIPEGYNNEQQANKQFSFTVDFTGNNVATEYRTVHYASNGTVKHYGEITDGSTVKLLDGEKIQILNIAPGTRYTVIESNLPGYELTSFTGTTGSVEAGVISEAKFVNTYSVQPLDFPSTGIKGSKNLTGRQWSNFDSYEFLLIPYNNAPLPAETNEVDIVTDTDTGLTQAVVTVTENTPNYSFNFGSIEYTKPGTYRYTIAEAEPENDGYLPGITYSKALYRAVIVVTDDGNGTMSATSDIQKLYTDDATQLFTYDSNNNIVMNQGEEAQDEIVFTNKYVAGTVSRTPVGIKTYIDNSGNKPLVSGMFTFEVGAVGVIENNQVIANTVNQVPMPIGSSNGTIQTTNEGHNITFPSIEFEDSDIPAGKTSITFRYYFKEVVPANAVNNKLNGMTYDDSIYYVDIELSKTATSSDLIINAIYPEGRVANFTNTYTPAPVTEELEVTKVLNGRDWKDNDVFKFNLVALDSAPLPTNTSIEIKKDDTTKGFENIQFTQSGTYKYQITEDTTNKIDGITYDTNVIDVVVTVTDNNGALEVTSETYDGHNVTSATFTNTYKANPVKFSYSGTKTLSGKTLEDGHHFFVVEPINGAPLKQRDLVVTTNGTGKDNIQLIVDTEFSSAKTYSYYIYEQIPTGATKVDDNYVLHGITYDNAIYRLDVTVADVNYNGQLKVTETKLFEVTRNENGEETSETEVINKEVLFENEYDASSKTITAPIFQKVIYSESDHNFVLQAGQFAFDATITGTTLDGTVLDGENGHSELADYVSPTTLTATNDSDGNIKFDDITFNKEGIYTVTVKEYIPASQKVAGIEYTTETYTIVYQVKDNGTGQLEATIVSQSGSTTFRNEYNTEGVLDGDTVLVVNKEFTGRTNNEWLDTDSFTFELIAKDEATLQAIKDGYVIMGDADEVATDAIFSATRTVTKTNKGPVNFKDITFTKAGTYKFVIHEKDEGILGVIYDSNPRNITVVATDNGNGTLTINTTIEDANNDGLTFKNVYKAGEAHLSGHNHLVVTKALTGRNWTDNDAFTFTLSYKGYYDGNSLTQDTTTDRVVLPSSNTLTMNNSNREYAHFRDITFKKVGTYVFEVTENIPANAVNNILNGIKYDNTVKTLIVNVTDGGEGRLIATLVINESDELAFTNEYKATEVDMDVPITKVLSGRDWTNSDTFNFVIEAANTATQTAITNDIVVIPNTTITITNAQPHTATFENITFKEAGNYSFTIKEQSGSIQNVQYDTHKVTVDVEVSDINQGVYTGILVATPTISGSTTFTNVFTPNSTNASFVGTKTLSGRTLHANEFMFHVEGISTTATSGKIPLPAIQTVKNTDGVTNNIQFGQIVFDEVGTYVYHITELIGSLPGITYDAEEVVAIVEVKQGTDGHLVNTVTYEKGSSNALEFNNTYSFTDSDPVTIKGIKVVTPSAGNMFVLEENQFEFEIDFGANNPASDPVKQMNGANKVHVKNDAQGYITLFNNLVFTEPGTYEYTVKEISNGMTGITYDNSVYTITIEVTDNTATAKLEADVTITKGNTNVNEIKFNNIYDPNNTSVLLYGNKVLDSEHKTLEENEFTFNVKGMRTTAADGIIPSPTTTTAKNASTGLFHFGSITFDKVGTYIYEISEVNEGKPGYGYDSTIYTVEITVSDNGGHLQATTVVYDKNDTTTALTIDDIQYVNTYNPNKVTTEDSVTGNIKGNKVLENHVLEAGEFEFKLMGINNAPLPSNTFTNNKADGTFEFESITFTKAGTYYYEVAEMNTQVPGVTTYDQSLYGVEIVVTDEGFDGQLEIQSMKYFKENVEVQNIEFINTYTTQPTEITISAIKELVGRDLREGEFKFNLYVTDSTYTTSTPIQTVSNVDEYVIFAPEKLTKAKTYYFVVEEVNNELERVTYDATKFGYEITVIDDGLGNLKVDKKVVTNLTTNKEENVVFHNIFTPKPQDITMNVNIEKTVKNTSNVIIGPKDFEFILVNLASGEKQVVKTDDNGKALFTLNYSEEDIDKTFNYKVTEVKGSLEEMIYDTTAYHIQVKVTLNENNELVATITNNGKAVDKVVAAFENINNASNDPILTINKKQATTDGKATVETLTVEKGDKVAYFLTVKNTGDGDATNVVITDALPQGLTYVENSATNDGKFQDGILTWNIDTLVPNKEVTVSFEVRVNEDDITVKNIGNVTADNHDDTPSNQVELIVVPEPKSPDTSDNTHVYNYMFMMLITSTIILVLKKKEALES